VNRKPNQPVVLTPAVACMLEPVWRLFAVFTNIQFFTIRFYATKAATSINRVYYVEPCASKSHEIPRIPSTHFQANYYSGKLNSTLDITVKIMKEPLLSLSTVRTNVVQFAGTFLKKLLSTMISHLVYSRLLLRGFHSKLFLC